MERPDSSHESSFLHAARLVARLTFFYQFQVFYSTKIGLSLNSDGRRRRYGAERSDGAITFADI